jgi:EmrB/QacA subfamily drug resistance transporter
MTTRADRETGRGSPVPSGPATFVLVVVCTAILLDALDLSITQVALPDIRHGLDLSAGAVQWVVNGYVLTYGGFLLLGGRAADLLGHRLVFLCGLLGFGAMSLAAGLAPSAPVLVVARAIQGVGAALTVPASVAIIATAFPEGRERNRALGFFSAAAAAGFSAGLVLGGVLTDLLDWRWIFLVKVPIVLVTLLLAYRVVPRRGAATRLGRSFDLPGALLATSGLLLLVFVITQVAVRSVALPVLVVAAVLAAGLLAGFVANEHWSDDPLLPLSIFRLRILRYADLASLTVLAAPFGYSFVTTLYTQEVRGYSPLRTGLALLPSAVLSALVSRYAAPALIQRGGLRFTGVLGLLLVGTGFLMFLWTGTGTAYLVVPLPSSLVCFGLGMGLAYPVFTVGGVTGVDDERQGLAAGIQQTALQVGGGIGLALVSSGVAASLGDATDPGAYLHALHTGVLVGTAIPLLGALTAFLGLRNRTGSQRPTDT